MGSNPSTGYLTNYTTIEVFPDKKTDLFIKMLAAIEGSRGTLSWEDIGSGAIRVAERKRQEAVAALVGSLPLTDVLLICDIASREALLERSKKRGELINVETQPTLDASEKQGPRKGRASRKG